MAENKTRPRTASVDAFLERATKGERLEDCRTLVTLMEKASREKATMWGPSIVGFGIYHYVYESGREGDTCVVGFSPRKPDLVLYLMGGLDMHAAALKKLGKYRRGKGCLYVKRLSDVDLAVLKRMIAASVKKKSMARRG